MAINGLKTAKDYPEHMRRVRFKDPTGKTLALLTNNTALPAPVIALFERTQGLCALLPNDLQSQLN